MAFNYQSKKYKPHALHKQVTRALLFKQGRHMSVSAYLEKFQNNIDILEHIGGVIGNMPYLIKDMLQENIGNLGPHKEELTKAKEHTTSRYQAAAFIANTDQHRYSILLEDLEHDFLRGVKTPKEHPGGVQALTQF